MRARLGLALGALVAGGLTVLAPTSATTSAGAATLEPPNVVLVTVDDMRADDIAHMPRTRRLLGRLTLSQFVSNHPACCPARAELLTGQLGQNNGVHHNGSGPWGGYGQLEDKDNTVARWFSRAGYDTAMVGKFVNGWRPTSGSRPQGWTSFQPLVGDAYSPYDYSYVDDGPVRSAKKGLHTNDFVTSETVARVREYGGPSRDPFLIWASYVAPHSMTRPGRRFGPPVPAARHVGTMEGVVPVSESKPSYEDPSARRTARALYADAAQAPTRRQVERAASSSVRRLNQKRLESLQSVDEGVARTVRALRREGELAGTVLVFTSDNGYLLGEHGSMGKNTWYEESLRVPLLARGPGVESGVSRKGSMITDIAPSLAALAGVAVERDVDGRSDLFSLDGGWPDDEGGVLVQGGDDAVPWLWRGVRTAQYTYVETVSGERLLFDRKADPHQLENLSGRRPKVEEALSAATPPLDEE